MAADLTLAITTYNRPKMTLKAFEKVVDHPRISEVLIVDDYSPIAIADHLSKKTAHIDKVRVIRNSSNLGCYHNKHNAVLKSTTDWIILLDSDNIVDNNYINRIPEELDERTIYAPDFARPHFDYTNFSNHTIFRNNVRNYVHQRNFDCLINTCNYVVNRGWYLTVWQNHKEPWTADTLFHNYNHLKAGGSIKIVKDMQYQHLVHDGSHYQQNIHKTNGMREQYMKKLERL